MTMLEVPPPTSLDEHDVVDVERVVLGVRVVAPNEAAYLSSWMKALALNILSVVLRPRIAFFFGSSRGLLADSGMRRSTMT